MASYRPYFNPATGEWVQYLETARETGGELVRYRWRSVPGGRITEHLHPHQEERFIIERGEGHFTVDGEEQVVRAGETLAIPPGSRHTEWNGSEEEIHGFIEFRPALKAKELHEALAGVVNDGRASARGAPRNPLQLGATFWHFRDDIRVISPPVWVQQLMLPPLAALAKLAGVKGYDERWDSREHG